MKAILITLTTLSFITSCTWKHNNRIVKDSEGNIYLLEANVWRRESYDLKQLPKSDIDSLNKSTNP